MELEEMEEKIPSFDIKIWKRIIKVISEKKGTFIFMIITNILQAIMLTIFPLFTKYVIDHFVGNTSVTLTQIWQFVGVFICFNIVFQFFNYAYFYLGAKIESEFTKSLRSKVFRHLQELSFSYFDRNSVGWIIARVTSDISKMGEMVGFGLLDFLFAFVQIISVFIAAFILDYRLAFMLIPLVIIVILITKHFEGKLLIEYRATRKLNSILTGDLNEMINGVKSIKTLGIESSLYNDFDKDAHNYYNHQIKVTRMNASYQPLIDSLAIMGIALLLYFGGYMVKEGLLLFGTLSALIEYVRQMFDPISMLAYYLPEIQKAQANGERVFQLLDEKPDIVDSDEVIKAYGTILNPNEEHYETIHGDVTFENVTFYYNEKEKVLENFNLEVKAGQKIGLVGETGSGKSTLVNLVCRFYEPQKGRILIDGKDIQDRSIAWIHHNLGYVLQAPYLFEGTIKDNIRFGRKDATDDEIMEACKMVNAHDFIMSLENGYDTNVKQGGARLSTGEKQLISFARALIANPRILILDEATSSIDTEKEKAIQDAIEVVQKGRTSFVVAHRLSTIVDADCIYVMKQGQIVESGTHIELMDKKGYYYRLYTNQVNESLENQLLGLDKQVKTANV